MEINDRYGRNEEGPISLDHTTLIHFSVNSSIYIPPTVDIMIEILRLWTVVLNRYMRLLYYQIHIIWCRFWRVKWCYVFMLSYIVFMLSYVVLLFHPLGDAMFCYACYVFAYAMFCLSGYVTSCDAIRPPRIEDTEELLITILA